MRVMAMKVIKSAMISFILLVLILSGLAGINSAKADDLTKRADGIEATNEPPRSKLRGIQKIRTALIAADVAPCNLYCPDFLHIP